MSSQQPPQDPDSSQKGAMSTERHSNPNQLGEVMCSPRVDPVAHMAGLVIQEGLHQSWRKETDPSPGSCDDETTGIVMLVPSLNEQMAAIKNGTTSTPTIMTADELAALGPKKLSKNVVVFRTVHKQAFRKIRASLGIKEDMLEDATVNAMWREAPSPGCSDAQFFYFGHYVVKSMKESEYRFFITSMLPAYERYVSQHPNTLLPQLLSVFSLEFIKRQHTQRYVLMNNVFATSQPIQRIYDLKGSTVGRSKNDGEPLKTPFGAELMKDNDLPPCLIDCSAALREMLLSQLEADTQFLEQLSIVDYSLLVGVRAGGAGNGSDCSSDCNGAQGDRRNVSVICISNGDSATTFYLGIIDIFQQFTAGKRMEVFAKGLFRDRGEISVVPPQDFAQRLLALVSRIVHSS